MSDYAQETWGWIHQPLQHLREGCHAEPDTEWGHRLAGFLAELGLASADEHPVIRALAEHVEQAASEDVERAAFVADDGFEALVYQWVINQAESPATPGDPGAVSERAVSLIGMPALRAVAAAQPQLLAARDAAALPPVITSVLAHRLTGQAPPTRDDLTDALLARIEELLAGNPETANEFWTVFGSEPVDVAEQWITYHLGQLASEIEALIPAPKADTTPAAYDLRTLVAAVLAEVPDAEEVLTPEELNEIVAEVLAQAAPTN